MGIRLAIDWVMCGGTDGTERKCIPRKPHQTTGFFHRQVRICTHTHTHTLYNKTISKPAPLFLVLSLPVSLFLALTGYLVLHRSSLCLITFSCFTGMNPHVSELGGEISFPFQILKLFFLICPKGTIN